MRRGPWNSAAVELGIGHILHFGSEIVGRAAEKVLAVRRCWADENPDVLAGLVRADSAARFVADLANREETAALVAAPRRLNVAPEIVRRTSPAVSGWPPTGPRGPRTAIW
jgi:NitT/TauT family transport system ATP-binding protein